MATYHDFNRRHVRAVIGRSSKDVFFDFPDDESDLHRSGRGE